MANKHWLQIGGIALALVALFLVFQPTVNPSTQQASNAETINGAKTGTLVVSGEGEVNMKPDMAYLNLGAQAIASSAEEAQSQVNEQMNAVRQVLEEYSIAEEQIQTAYFHVYPQYQPSSEGGSNAEEQYRAEHVLEVAYHDIDNLGKLIDAASQAGANRVDHIRFGLQNPEEAENEALQLAIENTVSKASVMAESAGKQRGEVIQITDQAAQMNFPMQEYALAESTEANSDSTSIESGEIQVTKRVDVIYRLQ
ncbi:SIMPL domain-containing protein [Halalkalibacterium ligniniphilum]|uniref:SIMPL domain-containing protein n=1 Tax=Halalkalibacterium ligniniphilum TaxID=1134413 RepID=UPI000345D20C|nr:SIMPL domain-containing protein [Halalkalibacterium ligniniphilum]